MHSWEYYLQSFYDSVKKIGNWKWIVKSIEQHKGGGGLLCKRGAVQKYKWVGLNAFVIVNDLNA